MAFKEISQEASKGFLTTLIWILKKWYFFIGGFALVMVIILGIKDSYTHKDIGYLVYNVGGRLMSPDGVIYNEVEYLKTNPQITIQNENKINSYWDKMSYKFGKWGSHIRILTSLMFLASVFYLLFYSLNLISETKLLNASIALTIMILLQMSFMLMTLYKNKVEVYPAMQVFLHTYSSIFYLTILAVFIIILFAIFNTVTPMQPLITALYTFLISFFIFIFLGYLGSINNLNTSLDKDNEMSNIDILKQVTPFRGVFSLITNYQLVLGLNYDIIKDNVLDINKNLSINKNIVI